MAVDILVGNFQKRVKKHLIFEKSCDILYAFEENQTKYAGVMELADVLDSKSSGSDTVRVRPPLPAPTKNALLSTDKGAFFE